MNECKERTGLLLNRIEAGCIVLEQVPNPTQAWGYYPIIYFFDLQQSHLRFTKCCSVINFTL